MSRVLDFFLAPPDPAPAPRWSAAAPSLTRARRGPPRRPARPGCPPAPPVAARVLGAAGLAPPGASSLASPPVAAPPRPGAPRAAAPPGSSSLAVPAAPGARVVGAAAALAAPGPPALTASAPPLVVEPGQDARSAGWTCPPRSSCRARAASVALGPPAPPVRRAARSLRAARACRPVPGRADPPSPHAPRRPRKRRGRGSEAPPLAPPSHADFTTITGAAVLGRTREAEPVAAALALVLRRETRSKAATVAVIGPPLPEASGGGGAGRRIAARLEAHGLEPRVRGRLAWVRLDPASPDLAEPRMAGRAARGAGRVRGHGAADARDRRRARRAGPRGARDRRPGRGAGGRCDGGARRVVDSPGRSPAASGASSRAPASVRRRRSARCSATGDAR